MKPSDLVFGSFGRSRRLALRFPSLLGCLFSRESMGEGIWKPTERIAKGQGTMLFGIWRGCHELEEAAPGAKGAAMDVYLAHEDSLKMLRYARREEGLILVPAGAASSDPARHRLSSELLSRALPRDLFSLSRINPVSLRSPDAAKRSQCAVVRSSPNLASLPGGSYLEVLHTEGSPLFVGPGEVVHVFVEAAGLVMLSGACLLNRAVREGRVTRLAAFLRLVALGMELCGSYARDPLRPGVGDICYGLLPVSSSAELPPLVRELGGMHGAVLARRAATYVNDGSGSTMETLWYLALCLPPRYGGVGLERPLQNVPVEWPASMRALSCHRRLTPDFYWPRYKSVGEYDSGLHKSDQAFYEDRNRAKDYGLLDLAYFPLTDLDTVDTAAMKQSICQLVAHFKKYEGAAFGRKMGRLLNSAELDEARGVLRATLLPPRGRWSEDM